MTIPDDPRRKSPADRFRKIISAEESKEQTASQRRYPKGTGSPSLNLPKARAEAQDESPTSRQPALPPDPGSISGPGISRYLPAFWTAASIISLLFNIILLIFLISLLRVFGTINATSIGPGLLGGLYTNFERMDQAHIKTTIPIQTTIPLDLSIPVQTTTDISLAKDVSIPGAHVRINTPLFNIDAPANVTLPAGTSLNVAMSFTLPVQAQVPVNLSVPVDIPLQQTDLHPAILGLQDTLRPLYCLVKPSAQTLSGDAVCH
jgi:hypothetical protein